MHPELLVPHSQLSPPDLLRLAQRAPSLLKQYPESVTTTSILLAGFQGPQESAELWAVYENLLVACLRTGDDDSAKQFLKRLTLRFGQDNQRIQALRGLVLEAEAKTNKELEAVLAQYNAWINETKEGEVNIAIEKRRISLLTTLGNIPEAIQLLTLLLDAVPTDPEAWAELAELYYSQALYPQAIFSLEEVLLLSPNAWSVHARLGEVLLQGSLTTSKTDTKEYLAMAIKRFCRSIELCEGYLRGYSGLVQTTEKALREYDQHDDLPEKKTLEALHEKAVSALADITRQYRPDSQSWKGIQEEEIQAARSLLSIAETSVVR